MKIFLLFLCILWVGAYQAAAKESVLEDMLILEPDADTDEAAGRTSRQLFYQSTTLGAQMLGVPAMGNAACITRDGKFGHCMNINRCYPERKIFKVEDKDTWIFGVYNACGHNTARGKQIYGVCCTKHTTQPALPSNMVENIVARRKPAKVLRGKQCSPRPSNERCTYDGKRIVNGNEASVGAYPFMAAMMRVSSISGSRQFCGGSLIDESHVLTAAHCIDGLSASDIKTLKVYLGVHNIASGQRTEHRVIRIIKHIKFNKNTLENDIAILTLETPAVIDNEYIQPVCLPTVDYNFVGERVTVAGWGALSEGGSQPQKLHKVDVTVWSNLRCAAKYDRRIPGEIVDSMLCAAADGKDSCSGDSGGPLYVQRNGASIQLGIVSWGIGCARADSPGVYTRVTKMIGWIQRIQDCY